MFDVYEGENRALSLMGFFCDLVPFDITYIQQVYFTGTGAIFRLHQYQRNNPKLQRDAVITRSIFSTILKIDTPQLSHEGEMWGVCCDSKLWFAFCHCYRSATCNIVNKLDRVITALDCMWLNKAYKPIRNP